MNAITKAGRQTIGFIMSIPIMLGAALVGIVAIALSIMVITWPLIVGFGVPAMIILACGRIMSWW